MTRDEMLKLLIARSSADSHTYTPLKYLKSNGEQYIDTGVYLSSNSRVETKVYYVGKNANDNMFYGVSNSYGRFWFEIYGSGTIYSSVSSESSSGNSGTSPSGILTIVQDRNALLINGESKYTYSTADFESNLTSHLFGYNNNGSSSYRSKIKVYMQDIYENNVLVASLRPNMRDDGVVGMLDLISGRFLTNAGSGEFEYEEEGYDIDFDIVATADQLTYQFSAKPLRQFEVEWGDGTSTYVTSGTVSTPSHTYSRAGTYRIRILDAENLFGSSNYIKPGANNTSANNVYAAMVGVVHAWKNAGGYFWGYSFDACVNMTGLEIPSGTTNISDYAFRNCSSWNASKLPSSITSITGGAFMNCTNVAFESLPSGLTSLSANTFRGCENLQFTALPDGITSIGSSCFYLCKNLPLVDLPSSLATLASTVFVACWRPSSNAGYDGQPHTLRFNSTPTSISTNIFNNDESLTDIYVPWTEGEVSGARWGATSATIHYNHVSGGITVTIANDGDGFGGHYTDDDGTVTATLQSYGLTVKDCYVQDTPSQMWGRQAFYQDGNNLWQMVTYSSSMSATMPNVRFGMANYGDTQTPYADKAVLISAYASGASAYNVMAMVAITATLS